MHLFFLTRLYYTSYRCSASSAAILSVFDLTTACCCRLSGAIHRRRHGGQCPKRLYGRGEPVQSNPAAAGLLGGALAQPVDVHFKDITRLCKGHFLWIC